MCQRLTEVILGFLRWINKLENEIDVLKDDHRKLDLLVATLETKNSKQQEEVKNLK